MPPSAAQAAMLAGFGPHGQPDPAVAAAVAGCWDSGGVVGLPTETVYGLSADAQNSAAVARIYAIKGRPAGHPLIVHVADSAALEAWSAHLDPRVAALAERFWPGPLTVVVARSDRAGDHVTGGQDTVALRCPAHPVALACLRAFSLLRADSGVGIAAPSANRFGRVSPTTAADVRVELGERLAATDLIVDGGPSRVGVESTIVDCTGDRPRILRPGAIGPEEVLAAWEAAAPPAATIATVPTAQVRTPGSLAAHYAPSARVRAVEVAALEGVVSELKGVQEVGLLALAATPDIASWTRIAAPTDTHEFAACLYTALRAADATGLAMLVAVLPEPGDALAQAVRDRLTRAAVGSAGTP